MNQESPELMNDEELLEELNALLDEAEEKYRATQEERIRNDRIGQIRELRKYLKRDSDSPFVPWVLMERLEKKGLVSKSPSRFVHDDKFTF